MHKSKTFKLRSDKTEVLLRCLAKITLQKPGKKNQLHSLTHGEK